MKIIVDAMGGDFSPQNPVEGARLALGKIPVDVAIGLVGDEKEMNPLVASFTKEERARIEVIHADDIITMHDNPATALKEKPDSSMIKGISLCKMKGGDGFVSTGNTGAQLAASLMIFGRLEGVLRPTISSFFPNVNKNKTIIIDVGANVECKTQNYVQFAQLATSYLKNLYNVENPKVGLLNIGEEEVKGTEFIRQCHQELKKAHQEGKINFFGNIEGRDIMMDTVNIVLCDGFIGNIVLKYGESIPKFMTEVVKRAVGKKIMSGAMTKEQGEMIGAIIKEAVQDFSDEQYGGVPLLGIDGVSIVCHGKSSVIAVQNAIVLAHDMIQKNITQKLKIT